MDERPGEELLRVSNAHVGSGVSIGWHAGLLLSLEDVARHVLADDASVALWRGRLGIAAEPKTVERLYVEPALVERIIKRLDDLENAERARQKRERSPRWLAPDGTYRPSVENVSMARRDAVKQALTPSWYCDECKKGFMRGELAGAGIPSPEGYLTYCQECWRKRREAEKIPSPAEVQLAQISQDAVSAQRQMAAAETAPVGLAEKVGCHNCGKGLIGIDRVESVSDRNGRFVDVSYCMACWMAGHAAGRL